MLGQQTQACVFAAGFLSLVYASIAAGDAVFKVADSIAITSLVNSDPTDGGHRHAPVFKFSPGGERFAVVTRHGDLGSGLNHYELLVFESRAVLKFVNSPAVSVLPKGEVLVRFSTASASHDGIEQVRWTSEGDRLSFIGRGREDVGRVYTASVASGDLRPLTPGTLDVASYGLSRQGDRLVFSAYVPPDWSARNAHGYAVASQSSWMLATADARQAREQNIRYFVAQLRTGAVAALAMDSAFRRPGEISISPSGRLAVVPNTVRRIPARWSAYGFIRNNPMRLAGDSAFVEIDDAFGSPDPRTTQYQLVDLDKNSVRPLLDAPTRRVGSDLRINARWSPDGRYVLLPPTFLPVRQGAPQGSHDTDAEAVIVVEVANAAVEVVAMQETGRAPSGTRARELTDAGWEPGGDVWLKYLSPAGRSDGVVDRYRRIGARWRKIASIAVAHEDPGGAISGSLKLRISQGLNVPAEIAACDMGSGNVRTITDLNPWLREKSLGNVREFEWQDRLGRRFTGGLMFPPRHVGGERLGVVLQTNGFYRHRFLVHGSHGMSSPHAAQALANRDLLVLQLPRLDPKKGEGAALKGRTHMDSSETGLFVAGIEGAIDALDKKGLIDRKRVGLLGFSREGMHVHFALAFSSYPIAAATVADSVALTPACYAATYGNPYPGMSEFDADAEAWYGATLAIGAPFWGKGIDAWRERSYVYHLDRIRTPIRFEEYGSSGEPCHWESFAILKRHRRPVEMIHIPSAAHNLRPPHARFTSQEGNVDWFDFWLNGREDPNPVKADQYRRWRKLRVLHAQHIREIEAEQLR